jgi:hypothetical protein
MWMYPGLICSDRSFPPELDDVEIDARIWKLLALGAHPNSSPSSIHFREGLVSACVSSLKLILA